MKHKDHYNDDYIVDIARRIRSVMPDFDEEIFFHDLIGRLDDKVLSGKLNDASIGTLF